MAMPRAFRPDPQPARAGGRRDRHGRGLRGALGLPGPLTPGGPRLRGTAARRFDDLVLVLARRLEERWGRRWGTVEFGVEETPLLPADWASAEVPLATLVPPTPASPARIVVFRRPIEQRSEGPAEVSALVQAVLVEQVAELLGLDPEEVDPRYED